MPIFEYQAVGADGQQVRGTTVSSSLDQALADLGRSGVQVLQIGLAINPADPLAGHPAPVQKNVELPATQEAGSDYLYATGSPIVEHPRNEEILQPRSYMATSVWGPIVGKVPLVNLSFFFRQLGTMLNAGVPFVQSLDTLANQARNPKLGRIIRELREHVHAGRPISIGMQRYPEVFSPVMVSLVRAGEHSGLLDESMNLIADYIDREIKLRNMYRRATFYPKFQLVASILIIIAANAIIGSISDSAQKLYSPLTNPVTWIWLGPLLVGGFLFLRIGLANPRIKHNWDMVTSMIPYLGKTLQQLSMSKFGRAFGTLYRAGVPMSQAYALAADSCGNEYIRSRMYPAANKLNEGGGITETFRQTNAFSPIVMDMVATGETTGNLDQMLGKMADYYEEEAETRSMQFAIVVGVLIGLAVMIYIGFLIIGFWSGYASQIPTS